jgi:hypothetical protein
MKWKTDIELRRMRRTLSLVKRKLEEALRLSQSRNPCQSDDESEHGRPAASHRYR